MLWRVSALLQVRVCSERLLEMPHPCCWSDVLARDVLLAHKATAAPGSHDGAGLDANELQHMYFFLFIYLIFVNSKPLFS